LQLEERALTPQLDILRGNMLISGILKNKPYWEDVLKEMSNLLPPEIYLTFFEAEGDGVRLSGNIIKSDENAQAVLSRFMLTLEEGIFDNVSLVTTQKEPGNPNITEFEIICKVD